MACEIKTCLVMPLLFLAASCLQHFVHGESKVPCLFIFGDSLSDPGNNNQLPTSAKSNYAPYGIDFPIGPTGRFTNGRNAIDIITQFLGFEKFIPPFANTSGSDILKGVNYASGAAGIRKETGAALGLVVNLGLQLAHHRVIVSQIASKIGSVDKAEEYLNKCLYYVNIGSDDYINNYFQPQFYPTSHIYTLEQYTKALIQELSLNLQDLHDIGARKYVLVGLGLLGCTPNAMLTHGTNGSCVEEEDTAAVIFNENLKSLVDDFNDKFSSDSKFIYIDSVSQAVALGGLEGFSVTTVGCCPSELDGGECIPDERPCYNRSDYVFWDDFHPTDAWNQLIASTSYNDSNTSITYPMDISHLVDYEIKMEDLELVNEIASQLSATK